MNNRIEVSFPAIPENESLARIIASAILAQRDPAISLAAEVRTAVSEAVTNAVVHAYPDPESSGMIAMRIWLDGDLFDIEIEDFGCGMEDVHRAMAPFYTGRPEMERSGLGFSIMQSFMDRVEVDSRPQRGTCVRMMKRLDAQ